MTFHESAIFTIDADDWYIIEYETGESEDAPSGYYARFTLYKADGDEPGELVASVQYDKEQALEFGEEASGTGSCTAPAGLLTTDEDHGLTSQDEGRTVYIDGLPFTINIVNGTDTFYFIGTDDELIDGSGLVWEVPATGPRWLSLFANSWVWDVEWQDNYVEFDWVRVWNSEDITVPLTPGEFELREGWITERCPVIEGVFMVSNSPARGTYNVYDLAGSLMELGTDYEQTDAAGGRTFRILNGLDYESVEVTYLGVPPSLRFRPHAPYIFDANYPNAQQIRVDNDTHGH